MSEAQYNLAPPLIERLRPDARQVASDETLIDRIAVGDADAMGELYVRHNVRVFRFLLGKVKERTIADDLIVEVFLELWQSARRFDASATVSTWLLEIAHHKVISPLRHHQTCQQLDELLAIDNPSENPKVAAEIEDGHQVLRDCLANLSQSDREILDLAYYHEESVESVAGIVGSPLNTVKTRMFYARKHLAALLLKAGVDRASL
jgi:RNA polymerase sigma-70 factor, ECF subfamily